MKMFWLFISTLLIHQAVGIRIGAEPVGEMKEILPTTTDEKVNQLKYNK